MNIKRRIFALIALLAILSCGEAPLAPSEAEGVKLSKDKASPKRPSVAKLTPKPKTNTAKPAVKSEPESEPLLSAAVVEPQPDQNASQEELGLKYQKAVEVAEDEVEKLATIIDENKRNLPYAQEKLRDAESVEIKAEIAKEIEYMQAQIGMTQHLLDATKKVLQAKEKVKVRFDDLALAKAQIETADLAYQETLTNAQAKDEEITKLTLTKEELKKIGLMERASLELRRKKQQASKWMAVRKVASAKQKLDGVHVNTSQAQEALKAAQVEVDKTELGVKETEKAMGEVLGKLEQELDALGEKNKAGGKPAR